MANYNQIVMESKESVDLNFNSYLTAVKRHWVPAVGIFAATTALGIVAASLMKSSYPAEGRLLFKNSTFKVVGSSLTPSSSEGGDSGELKPLVATQNPVVTQVEVLTSRPLLKQTIDRLQLKNTEGKLVKPEELQTAITAKVIGGSDVVQLTYKSRKAKESASVINTLMDVFLENDIRNNSSDAETARKFMAEQLPKTQADVVAAESALRKFKQQNNVVDLSEESKSAVSIIGNLENSINSARSELEQLNAQTQDLTKKLNLNSQEALIVSEIAQSKEIQATLSQLQDTERQLATESSRFSDSNPIIISLKEKQTKLKTLLGTQVQSTIGSQAKVPQGLLRIGELKQSSIGNLLQLESQRTGLTKKLASLENSQAEYERRTKVIPQLIETQRQLERQLEVSQSIYQNLSKKVRELQLAKNRNTANARIIASAVVPEKPDTTPKMLVGGLGILLGALFGTSAIAYLEIRDKSLKTLKEIDDIFGYRLLGAIPNTRKKSSRRHDPTPEMTTLEVAVRDTPESLTSEMARTIQANLRFFGTERQLKTIAISSAIANEGKSKVAANLAAAIAATGQRVLLIDADLRVPYQHRFWKLPLKRGVSDILVKKIKFQQISWTVMENLDVLTAGARPPNPQGCLESERMTSLLAVVADEYDIVIVDTPPILVASDALIVGRQTDGIIVVSRPGTIDRARALAAKEQLALSGCEVLGTIVNGVIAKYESEDIFACNQDYFSAEQEAEVPWTDYMTQLGETIADRSRTETKFSTKFGNTK